MNELLKTQRISIAVLFFGLILLIGLMVRKAPKAPFTMTATEMLDRIPDYEHVTLAQAHKMQNDTNTYIFVDLRSPYDFEVKHVENAINIPTAFILDNEHRNEFNRYLKSNKTVVLYGQTERESISPWILLTEIGYTNTKVLLGGFECYNGNKTVCTAGTAKYDYAKISRMGALNSGKSATTAPEPVKKKAIPVKKKKKREAEGGC